MAASSTYDRWKYDVFVSFRGEDIRKSFMDHLLKDFKQKGIQAFRDDKELPKGEVISPGLYKAIDQSRFLIVIFSKNYASSSWCLRELMKILECKERAKPKHEVRIIFYDVKPDVVRKQTESYAEAFDKHESSILEVAKVKEALTMAANLSGWDLEDLTNGYEAKFIDNISREILKKLCDGPLHVGENLVGVDAHLKNLNFVRFSGSNKVHMIGICGISGIGKTTLAKAIYNLMYTHFEGRCFCDDVQGVSKREGLIRVQTQLIDDINKTTTVKISNVGQGIMILKKMMSSKPVLLVLDDVDHWQQLEALAGSPNWFSPGSLIIFTCKDKQLLKSHRVEEIYDMDFLDEDESLEIFCSYAFHEKYPMKGFEELAESCEICASVDEWDSELDNLKLYPNDEIQQVLRLSYDGLNCPQQRILLDIAFSFIGMKSDLATSVLDSCGLCAVTNMRVLVDKSLITISHDDTSLQMHGLIQNMAREIVRKEDEMPGKRSRLWGPPEEIYDVLSKNKATEEVEVINLWKERSTQKFDINASAFARLNNLRILKLPKDLNVKFSGKLGCLSNKLRYLCWNGCPFRFLPSRFYPENIVVIDLSYSSIKNIWTTPKCFTRLKILKLSHCHNLTKTPDFTHITNLEELILEGCVSLVEFHPSIAMLKRLVVLNLSGCFKVDHVPEAIGRMKSLLELHIDGTAITRLPSSLASLPLLCSLNLRCCNILQMPENIGDLSRLEILVLSGNNFTSLPESLSQLSRLERLELGGCKNLEVFPELPRSIVYLDASNCNILKVSENIGSLSSLQRLILDGNSFTCMPESLSQLSRLWWLQINGCKKLEIFPKLPPNIERLYASDCNIIDLGKEFGGLSSLEFLDLSGNKFTSLPDDFCQFPRLKELILYRCYSLEKLPELPRSLEYLNISDCKSLLMTENIGGLSCLTKLDLSRNNFTTLPESLSQLSRLWWLDISGCKKLEVFPELPSSIIYLDASYCNILHLPEYIGGLSCLTHLDLKGNIFTSLPRSFSQLSSLRWLDLGGCKKLEVLPELSPSIEYIDASDCNILQVPEHIGGLSCLKELYLNGNNFTSLPRSLSRLSRLHTLSIDGCKMLEVLPELPPNIEEIYASDCTSLRELGDLDCTRVSCSFLNCPNLQETESLCNYSYCPNFQETESESDA